MFTNISIYVQFLLDLIEVYSITSRFGKCDAIDFAKYSLQTRGATTPTLAIPKYSGHNKSQHLKKEKDKSNTKEASCKTGRKIQS